MYLYNTDHMYRVTYHYIVLAIILYIIYGDVLIYTQLAVTIF